LAGVNLNISALIDTQKSPANPAEVVRILSVRGMGRIHTSTRIVIPPIPNSTISKMFNALSSMAVFLPSFSLYGLLDVVSINLYDAMQKVSRWRKQLRQSLR